MTRIAGLYREAECSPGRHRSNDARLLEALGAALSARGFDVDLLRVDPSDAVRPDAAVILSMWQGPAALDILARWAAGGAAILNTPASARNTYRDRLAGVLARAGVAFPSTAVVPTSGPVRVETNGPLWLKRGDVHASVSADVQRVESAAALARGLAEFASRGIAAAAVQAHCEGDEIKFYGVAPGRFFHWYYTGTPAGRPVDPAALARLAARAAAAAGLHVYGGDAIVAPDGALTLIDLNDWPSFAPCRDEAVAAIADLLEARADAVRHHRPLAHPNQSAV